MQTKPSVIKIKRKMTTMDKPVEVYFYLEQEEKPIGFVNLPGRLWMLFNTLLKEGQTQVNMMHGNEFPLRVIVEGQEEKVKKPKPKEEKDPAVETRGEEIREATEYEEEDSDKPRTLR